MDLPSELTPARMAAIGGALVLILIFAVYVYMNPRSVDFFANPPEQKKEQGQATEDQKTATNS